MTSKVNISAMLRQDFVTVQAQFNGGAKPYTYKVLKALKPKKGDFAIVQVRGRSTSGLVIVELVKVHDDDMIDYTSDIKIKWLVSIIDFNPYDQLVMADEANQPTQEGVEK